MAKSKENIAGLIRDLYIKQSSFSESEFKELRTQLSRYTSFYIKRQVFEKDSDDLIKDITDLTILKVLESFQNDEIDFWEQNEKASSESDKKINAYIYQIIKGSYRESKDKIATKESTNLYESIELICDKFTLDKYLNKINNKYFALYPQLKCSYYFNDLAGSISRHYINLRRGKDQLDHKKLKEYIEYIFSELENYCFTISDLTRLVSSNSNYGIFIETKTIDPTDNVKSGSTGDSRDNIKHISGKKLQDELEDLDKNIIRKWLCRFREIYDEDERLENALILVFFANDITYIQIESYLEKNNIAKISKSTVKNRIDNLLQKIGFHTIKNEGEDKSKYLKYFLKELEKKFVPLEHINNMRKMKSEESQDG